MKDLLKEIVENKRVVLVGPSPHLVGQGMGSFINSYDIVCRINEVFPISLENDYGNRTDIAFWNLCNAGMSNFKQMISENKRMIKDVKLIVCPRNSSHVLPRHENIIDPNQNVFKNYESLGIDNSFFHIGNILNEKFEKSFDCHPTLGALTIMTLLEYEIKELFVCGMSFFQTKNRYNISKERTYTIANGGTPPRSLFNKPGHDLQKEVAFLRKKVKNLKHINGDFYFNKIILNEC